MVCVEANTATDQMIDLFLFPDEKSKTYNVVHLASNDNSKRETDTEDLMKGEIVKKCKKTYKYWLSAKRTHH